jgi:hypothetical protein
MSKIISAYPPPEVDDRQIPFPACWWRLWLRKNDDGFFMILRTFGAPTTSDPPTSCEWEFFDGYDTVIDLGVGGEAKRVAMFAADSRHAIDILSVRQPTLCPGWTSITWPGEHEHPGKFQTRDTRRWAPSAVWRAFSID